MSYAGLESDPEPRGSYATSREVAEVVRAAGGRRRATAEPDGPAKPTEPGLLEALAYAGDRQDRLEHQLGNVLARVSVLEGKLAPVLRQAPPADPVPNRVSPQGSASDLSSVLAQQIITAGHRTDRHADDLLDLADRLDRLTDLVDLA